MEGNERMYSNSSCCRVYWLRYWGQWSPRLAICCLCVCTGVTATPTLWMSNSSTTALSLSQCCYRNIFSIETFSLSLLCKWERIRPGFLLGMSEKCGMDACNGYTQKAEYLSYISDSFWLAGIASLTQSINHLIVRSLTAPIYTQDGGSEWERRGDWQPGGPALVSDLQQIHGGSRIAVNFSNSTTIYKHIHCTHMWMPKTKSKTRMRLLVTALYRREC